MNGGNETFIFEDIQRREIIDEIRNYIDVSFRDPDLDTTLQEIPGELLVVLRKPTFSRRQYFPYTPEKQRADNESSTYTNLISAVLSGLNRGILKVISSEVPYFAYLPKNSFEISSFEQKVAGSLVELLKFNDPHNYRKFLNLPEAASSPPTSFW